MGLTPASNGILNCWRHGQLGQLIRFMLKLTSICICELILLQIKALFSNRISLIQPEFGGESWHHLLD
jgi:hypothetical protein